MSQRHKRSEHNEAFGQTMVTEKCLWHIYSDRHGHCLVFTPVSASVRRPINVLCACVCDFDSVQMISVSLVWFDMIWMARESFYFSLTTSPSPFQLLDCHRTLLHLTVSCAFMFTAYICTHHHCRDKSFQRNSEGRNVFDLCDQLHFQFVCFVLIVLEIPQKCSPSPLSTIKLFWNHSCVFTLNSFNLTFWLL